MVAQATLTRLVMVRIHVGQPFDARSKHRLLMACGRQVLGIRELPKDSFTMRRMALSKRSGSNEQGSTRTDWIELPTTFHALPSESP